MDEERRSRELQDLQITVAKLATIMESVREKLIEKNEDMRIIKHDVANILNALNALPVMNDKISENSKAIAAASAKIESIESWKDKNEALVATIALHANKLETLEAWKKEIETKAGAYKSIGAGTLWFFGTFGGAIIALLSWYFTKEAAIGGE